MVVVVDLEFLPLPTKKPLLYEPNNSYGLHLLILGLSDLISVQTSGVHITDMGFHITGMGFHITGMGFNIEGMWIHIGGIISYHYAFIQAISA